MPRLFHILSILLLVISTFSSWCTELVETYPSNLYSAKEYGDISEEYITALYSLIDTWDFGALKDEMMRDRLVGDNLWPKLQMKASLTLEAKKEIKEKLYEGSCNLLGASMGEVKRTQHTRYKARATASHNRTIQKDRDKQDYKCTRRGKRKHKSDDKCPAKTATL